MKTQDKTEDVPGIALNGRLLTPNPKHETRRVQYRFSIEEMAKLGKDLAAKAREVGQLETDFAAVKKTHQARIEEAEASAGRIGALIDAGFDERELDCEVHYYPDDKIKLVVRADTKALVKEEPMSPEDFNRELIQAEGIYEARAEIELWDAGADRCVLIVGRREKLWFSAVRGNVGKLTISERLDSEQQAYKKRFDAVQGAAKRLNKWLAENVKEAAKGFAEPIAKAVEAQKEREE